MDLKAKIKLGMKERMSLYGLVPQRGNEVTYPLVRAFRDGLALSEEEIAKAGFVTGPAPFEDFKTGKKEFVPDGFVRWNTVDKDGNEIDLSKEFEIGPTVLGIIRGEIEKLRSEKKLDDNTFPLWELFCKEGGE